MNERRKIMRAVMAGLEGNLRPDLTEPQAVDVAKGVTTGVMNELGFEDED